ncbi:MAG: hypothetical protein GW893_24415, partial [Armatimonadetes bacterium]|nr:hypothetical protein [Armatimonadota bacterium]
MVDAKIPDFALPYGFLLNPRGALTAGTIRLKELSLLIDSTSIEAPYEELRRIGVEENALLKDTHYTRVRAFRCLRDFYALDLQLPVYRVFRELWEHDSAERPLLALLLASAREPIIRATAPYILRRRAGDRVDPADLEEVLGAEFPGQYSETSLRRLGQHLASAYQQSGHLSGKVNKVRSKATSGPASTA